MQPIELTEWQVASPDTTPDLAGLELGDAAALKLAVELAQRERIRILELRHGLRVETTSFVGSLQIGSVHLNIRPKLQGLPLLNLLRYAYGLRHLDLFSLHDQGTHPHPTRSTKATCRR